MHKMSIDKIFILYLIHIEIHRLLEVLPQIWMADDITLIKKCRVKGVYIDHPGKCGDDSDKFIED